MVVDGANVAVVVATLNDYEVKVVKVKGEFVWHSHSDTDELFLVVEGTLTIRRTEFNLGEGEWKQTDMVADDVQIRFSIPASANCKS